MEILATSTSNLPLLFPNSSTRTRKYLRPRLRCLGKNGERNGLASEPSKIESESHDNKELYQDRFESIKKEKEKQHDIWKLFKEAQQNILYLNKQRLLAMEELKSLKSERNSLLEKIEKLEAKKFPNTTRDRLSIRAELLLRIDSMVLTGTIGSREACDLRRLAIDSGRSLTDDFSDIIYKPDAELLAELCHFSERSRKRGLHIVHICTEMAPLVIVGSLASYITGLSCALQQKGNIVEVILPKYASLNLDEINGLREIDAEFYSYFNGQLHANRIWTGVVHGIGVTFIEPVYYSSFFSRDRVYGYSNDFERFTYFCRASLDYIVKSGKQLDVLHIHNWQTSIVGPLFWDVFVNQGLQGTRILLTCQDFDSQCIEQPEKLALCGLDPSRLNRPDRLQDNNKSHLINILKGGVVYSNKVIILSSMQSKGRIISALAHGLEPTLAIHKDKLLTAPIGFDKSTWDPSQDKFLPRKYSADNLMGKSVCKISLQRHLNLPEQASQITVGCICLEILDIDLETLKRLVWMAARRDVQFIFMGFGQTTGVSGDLELFQDEVKDESVRFIDKYDEEFSHLIFAGSDIMLCPSFDDPLLQVPLKAMKYGAAPVSVNFADGGFRRFMDHDMESTNVSQYINYTFANMSLSQAIDEIKNNPSEWTRRITEAMRKDFSWDGECSDIHFSAYTDIKRL